ncbi:two-partner secretion domain-containing protein [Rhizobium rhizogenes]|uniref:two-partner secretion domain-containing protein n=4 Tax=Rhizobium rhizogenes TaxID=359 RepID=UPI0015B3A61B|nr:hemagglutinin repeat-containing protein [Rhizobium rhizogenes]NTF63321.1 filamentous hemagglutinin N-terminal domain-containing protein [Rhizobium rhizogenes]NTG94654.1 filamentous hemagglutinin N-terminal domain-containing protein [Rhizobium rhizogenes]
MGKHPRQGSGKSYRESTASQSAAGDIVHRLVRLAHKALALTLSSLLVLQPTIANAQSVSASTAAPTANQPGVGTAPNGVPLIDIVTPNGAGLSHNKFSDFNVGTPGLILNNFKGEVGTSNLGGATPGNPNLNSSSPASVILNEVTSGNRSALNGPTEVFGGRADVIVANPNGITCNGCGFINTPHATLTTGVPNIGSDGSLTGFTVNGGDVTFEGAGGNFAAAPGAVDLFDVVARNIHVNAPIYGKTLRLTGGASQYNYATGEATALTATSGTPEYAIDGSALGAMQADRIKVVVTEKGAGVKMSGDMAANAGELSLSADGKISIGNASGSQGVTITSKRQVTAAKVSSKQKVAVQADQGITLQSVAADSDIVLASGTGLLSVSGDINSGTTVQMSSGGGIAAGSVTAGNGAATLSATSGNIAIAGAANSTGDLNLTATAGSISAASLLSNQNIALSAGLDIAVSGNVLAQGNVSATGRSIATGMAVSGINIAATSADPNGNVVLGSAGNLSLTATGGNVTTGNLLSAGSLSTSATGNMTAGNIQTTGNFTATAASLTSSNITSHGAITVNASTNASGQILGAGNVLISGAAIQAGAIVSGVDFAATNAAGGTLAVGPTGTLDLTATTGNIVVGTLLSAGDLNARSALLQANTLTGHGNVGIDGGVRVANQLLGAGDITINGNANGVSAGLLASGVDFAATKAAGGNIVVANSGDLTVNDSLGAIQAGTIMAAGAINTTGQTITADTITGHQNITLSGATAVTGQILGAGNVSVSGPTIAADAIVSGVDIAATDAAGGRITLGPTTTGTGNLTLAAAGLLSADTLLSAGNLDASGANITADNISAHGNLTLDGASSTTTASGRVDISGQILGAGNVLISGQSLSAQTVVAGLDFDATNGAGGNIVLGQAGDLTVSVNGAVTAPTIQAAGVIDISGASVAADAITGHKDLTLSSTAAAGVDVTRQVLGGGSVDISGASIKAGTIVSGVDFARTAAANGNIVQTTSGDVSLTSSGKIDAGTLLSAGDLSAAGSTISADSVTAHGDVTVDGATTVAGQILGAGNVLITGQSLSAQTVVAGIDFDATNAASGNIVLGQAGDLTIAVNGALAAPTLQAAGAIDAHAASISANAVTGHKGITLSGATGGVDIDNQVLGGGDISIAGSSIKAGTIVSGVDFARTAAANGTIVQASSGDLTLASSGSIDAGTLLSAGDLSAAGSAISADSVTAHGDVTVDGATTVAGQILGAGNVLITGQSLSAQTVVAGIDFAATNAASGNIVLGQAGDLSVSVNGAVTAPTIQAAGVIDISGASVAADAITGHKGITLSGATGGVDIDSQVLGGGDISVAGSSIKAGTIVSGVDFAATAAADGNIVLASSGDLNLASTGNINTATLLSASDLKVAGSTVTANAVTAHGAVTLDGATTVNGQILGAGNVLITGQSLSAQTIISGIDFSATNASGGDIVLGQAGDLTVSVNGVVAAPTLQAAGAIDVSGTSITAAAVTGHKDITLSSTAAGGVDVSGQILGGNDVAISGQSITAGTIVSGVDFARTAAANGNIVQTVSGDVSLISTGDITVGTLLSAGDLTTDGANLKAGSLTAHGDATLKASGTGASGRVDISGQVLSAGDLAINANSLNAGLLVSGVDFAATGANGGNIKLASSGDTDLTISGNATAGTILSAGDVTAKAANLTADSITSHGNVAITATGVAGNVEVNNQILAAGNLTINGGSITAPVLISGIDFAATNAAGGNIVLGSSATSAGNRAGSMNLTASGNIAGGTILSAGDLTAKAADLIADSITSHGNVGITGDVAVSNQILSAGTLTINGGSISAPVLISGIDFAATNAAGGSIVLGSSGGMNLTASAGIATQTMLSAGVIEASGSTITANAVTGHGDITLAGSSSVKVTGQLLGGNDVSLSGQTVQVGQAITGVDFATTAQSSNGAIALGSSGDLDINAGSATAGTLIVAGNLDVLASAFTGGNITSHGAVSIGSSANPGAIAINGQLLGGSNVSITGSGISGNVIVAGVDFAATSQSATGNIVLGQAGDLTLKATSGNVTSNSLMAAGSITANASNNVSANAVAHRDLTITAGNAITLTGQSLASRNANLSARSMTIDTLVSGVDFAATNAAAGGSLMLQRSGTMTLAASNGSINANSLLSGGNLAASATQNIGYSSLQSLGNATLTAPGAIAYTSTTRVGGNLTLNTGALDLSGTRGSRIAGGGSLIVNASSANLSGSNLVFGGLALNLSGGADLSNAQVSTVTNAGGSGDIAISAAGGLTTNANTELLAAHDLTLTLPSLGNSGQLAAANNVTFNIAGDFNNTPSGLVFAGNNANLFVGGTLNNNQGALLSGNGLTIAGPGGGQRNGAVVNTAGLIQSGGTMSILTDTLVNTTTSTPAIQRNVQISNEILSPYDVITETTRCATRCNGSGDHDPPTYETVQTIDHLVSQLIAEDQLTAGAGADAKIRAGGNLTINATNLTNSYSSIKSDGDMTLTVAGTLTNDGATLNRTVTTTCDSSTPCQYYPDVGNSDNPNGTRDPSKDLAAGTAVSVQAIGVLSGVIQARGALNISAGAVNNVASNGSIAGQVAIDAAATASNPLGALNSMTAGGALFNVNAALTGVAANGGATAGSGPSLTSGGPTIGSGPAINGNSLAVAGATSIGGNNLTVTGGTSISGNGVTAAGGPAITGNSLTAGGASINPNSLIGKLTAAIGNSGNLTQILQVNGAQLAALAKPQSGGVGGTVPGQVFLFETRAAFLDVSKFYGSGYFIDRIGYTPETKVPFLGDAYFDNQLVDEQMRQLVGDGLGAGSFVPGNNATDQMKTLLDNGVAYAEANGLALGQALSPEQVANLSESMVIYQAEVVDGAPVLVPVVYLSAADRAKTTSAATIAGNTVSIDAGSVDNSGAIAAADGMTINATDIKANGGAFLAGGNMNLNAANGITLAAQTMNIGGQTIVAANGGITAGGSLKVDAGAGSLTLAGTKVTSGGSAQLSGQTVTVGAVKQDNGGVQTLVGTTVTTGGNLSIAGTSGVNIIASSAKAGGDLSVLSTNGAVNIISAGVVNTVLGKDRQSLAAGGTTTTTTSQTQQGSSLVSGGTMLVSGDQGVLIGGSSLDAGGNLGVVSQNGNIAITASQDETSSSSKTKSGAANDYKSGSSSSTALTSNGSSITSGNGSVTVQADKGDISVIASDIDAKGGTATLSAKGDVTIGEATDSASSSSKSGSKKASEATTTAEGSSVSGQTGVSIASTGGNVTISASDVTAGDATHTADANIQAAGNIVIASGKDTDETTSDSKKSGFLSSSKTHTHTYDETNVGSSISATGNVNVTAGGETVISGSEMAAGGNLSLSGSTVTIMGAEEEHESDKQTKKSGIGVGSGGGFISIYGSKDSKSSNSQTDNIGSTLSSGGTTTITSTQGDVNIFGSSSHSGDGTVISSARDVNIAPGAEEQSSSSQTKRSGFGINLSTGNGSASIGIGVGKSEEKRSKDANTNAVTSLDSDGSITIAAKRDINDQSGQITADGPIGLVAGNDVNLLSSNDVTNASEMQKKSFAGVSLTVQSSLISAGQSAVQSISTLSGDNSAYGIAPTVLAGVNGYNALQAIEAPANQTTGKKNVAASISLTAGYSFSESSQESTTSIPVPPTVRGSSVTIVAEAGDVVGRGVQISAGMGKDGQAPTASDDPNNGNVLISAAGNVDLESVQATSENTSSSSAGSVAVGYSWGFDVDKNQVSAGFTANASGSEGKSKGSSVTQVNSNVVGSNTVTVVSGDTLTLAGAVLSGNTVNASATNGIVIESRQDTASYDEKSQSASLGISGSGISGGYNKGTITGDYANVSQQSGIVAGSGGYHVVTDGTIDLNGGIIASSADPKNNDLTADQILYSNIANSMSASSTSYGISLIGAGIPVPVVGQPAKQSDHGETLATITPGNWDLANQQQDLSGLNTDASKANNTVNPFDIDKLQAAQQSTAALSQLANMAIGKLAVQMQWDEGSPEKIALHAAAAAVIAQLAGGSPGQAALGAGVEELANGILQQVLKANPDLTDVQKAAIGEWAAAFVGAAVGGTLGAAASLDNFNYNFLTHQNVQDEVKSIKETCAKYGAGSSACINAMASLEENLVLLNKLQDNELNACRDLDCVNKIKEEILASKEFFGQDFKDLEAIDGQAAEIFLGSQRSSYYALQNAEVIGSYCQTHPGDSCAAIAIGLKLAQEGVNIAALGAVGGAVSGTAIAEAESGIVQAARQRQANMLNDDVGYNVSPSSWDSYPTIGRSGTYITDQQAITDILGPLNTAGETFITIEQQSQLEAAMGLQPGSLAGGFKVRQVTGITEMSPRSPLEGNKLFQGAGQHLPGGGPEMVVDSIPTTDTTSVTTITTVRVK